MTVQELEKILYHFFFTDLPLISNIRCRTKAATLENIENARKKVKLKRYISLPAQSTSNIWSLLSSSFPFTDTEINDYMHLLNPKNLLKNPFLKYMGVSKDTLAAVQLLNDIT